MGTWEVGWEAGGESHPETASGPGPAPGACWPLLSALELPAPQVVPLAPSCPTGGVWGGSPGQPHRAALGLPLALGSLLCHRRSLASGLCDLAPSCLLQGQRGAFSPSGPASRLERPAPRSPGSGRTSGESHWKGAPRRRKPHPSHGWGRPAASTQTEKGSGEPASLWHRDGDRGPWQRCSLACLPKNPGE